jgi:CRISPR-associated Csx2 family protein
MAKAYLSFLGTSPYVPCTYYQGDFQARDVSFVQEATVQMFCKTWGREDRILIFTTDEAYRKNWVDRDQGTEKEKLGLESKLKKLGLDPVLSRVPIPEGKSETEIWEIFQIVLDQLKPNDQVVFDITHAFRSIPMLAVIILHYAKVMKNVGILGIYYGAFEVLGRPDEVRNMPLEERKAPIFDLTPFDSLLDWSLAIDRFLGAGDAAPACSLADCAVQPLLRGSQGKDQAAATIRKVSAQLNAFTKALATCRGPEITDLVESLKENLGKFKNHHLLPALTPLLQRIREHLSIFSGDKIKDGIKAARWCLEHNLIQQGYTLLLEFLICYLCRETGTDWDDRRHRTIVSEAIGISRKGLTEDQWGGEAREHPEITRKILTCLQRQPKDLLDIFSELAEYRNDLNHGGWRKSYKPAKKFEEKLRRSVEAIEQLLC